MQKSFDTAYLKGKLSNGYLRRADTPLIESPKPTDEHGWHADDDSSMMPLWFAGDCLPKVLIDNEDLPNMEESDDDDDDDDDDDEDDDDVDEEDDFAYSNKAYAEGGAVLFVAAIFDAILHEIY